MKRGFIHFTTTPSIAPPCLPLKQVGGDECNDFKFDWQDIPIPHNIFVEIGKLQLT
jgi:hypothetical protein